VRRFNLEGGRKGKGVIKFSFLKGKERGGESKAGVKAGRGKEKPPSKQEREKRAREKGGTKREGGASLSK